MKLLELVDVTKVFGGLTAVSDLSFELDMGSNVVIIGKKGDCKKTVFH